MKHVCRVLNVARASYYKRPKGMIVNRYRKSDDGSILQEVRALKDKRPTYGYKRITAMLNRKRRSEGKSKLNKKRIFRIMDMNDLLFRKYPKRRKHPGTGKVMTLHSNTRWCSDAFEIHCFNGEKVFVAFSLDCKDREAIHFVARDRQLWAKDIKELMYESVYRRFQEYETPHKIQWLTDRGTIYRAHATRNAAREVGLLTCYGNFRSSCGNNNMI